MKFVLLCALALLTVSQQTKKVTVVILTSKGDIEVELDTVRAPETTKNFLRYVDAGHYNGGRFHRTVTMGNQSDKKIKIEVVQGGVSPTYAEKDFPPIKLERTNRTGILHKHGVISMARNEPDTATSDFFICINDQPQLDYGGQRNPDGQGFAAFGRVTKGMDVVLAIQRSPAKEQSLEPPISIKEIRRKK